MRAQVSACADFVLTGRILLGAQNFFRSLLHSLVARAPEIFIWGCPVTARHAAGQGAMQKFFLSQPRSSAVRAAFLCPVAVCSVLTARAVTFCDRSLLQKLCRPRIKENIFLSLPRRSVRAAGRAEIIFLSQPSKRVRTPCRFFLPQPCSSAGSTEIFFCAAFSVAAQQTFFCCPVASEQQSARAEIFFAQFFLLSSGLIYAEPF
jgi:hypothetical protein